MKTLTIGLSPQGNPATYHALDTPSGQVFDAIPEGHAAVAGTQTSFFIAAADDNPGVNFFILNSRRGGSDVALGITATNTWWSRQHSEEELRDTFRRCLPHFPSVWHEECVQAVMQAHPKAPRCAAPPPGPLPAAASCRAAHGASWRYPQCHTRASSAAQHAASGRSRVGDVHVHAVHA